MAVATQQSFRERVSRFMYENKEGFSWIVLWLFACLLAVFAFGLWAISRSQCRVVFRNDSGAAIHDVTLRPAAASSREPKHFLPHLSPGGTETFVLYPLGPCALFIDYRDASGQSHRWEGGRLSPRTGRTVIHLEPSGEFRLTGS